jgi:hypothetical protein
MPDTAVGVQSGLAVDETDVSKQGNALDLLIDFMLR